MKLEPGKLESRMGEVLAAGVEAGVAPGVVAVATDRSGVTCLAGAGSRDVAGAVPMATDTIFYIASMTKAITTVAAMQLVERGALALDAPIGEVLPALAEAPVLDGYDAAGEPVLRPAKRPVTLRHLLSHTSGLAYAVWNRDLFEFRRRFPELRVIDGADVAMSAPLVCDPGERWQYSTSTDWVGFAIEAASGKRLDEYFREHVFEPVGMPDTGFELPPAKEARVAARVARQPDGAYDEVPGGVITPRPFHSGGGGLHSTASDYAAFLRALLGGGDAQLLSPETVASMGENQIGDGIAGREPTFEPERSEAMPFFPGMRPGFGLGFLLNPEPVPGGRAAGSLAWGGLLNTYFWLDPMRGVAGAFFTQLLPFCDAAALELFDRFERAVYADA